MPVFQLLPRQIACLNCQHGGLLYVRSLGALQKVLPEHRSAELVPKTRCLGACGHWKIQAQGRQLRHKELQSVVVVTGGGFAGPAPIGWDFAKRDALGHRPVF